MVMRTRERRQTRCSKILVRPTQFCLIPIKGKDLILELMTLQILQGEQADLEVSAAEPLILHNYSLCSSEAVAVAAASISEEWMTICLVISEAVVAAEAAAAVAEEAAWEEWEAWEAWEAWAEWEDSPVVSRSALVASLALQVEEAEEEIHLVCSTCE